MSLSEDVADLQARIEAARRERARAEGARDAAQAAAENARAELKREFGLDSVEGAETMLGTLKDELAEITEQISVKLTRIGV